MLDRLMALTRARLVRNILALYGVRAVEQLLPLLVLPYLARMLGPTSWGMFAIAQAFAMYGIVTVEYGFSFSGTRAVASARDQAAQLAELVSGVFVAQLLLALVVTLAATVARFVVPVFQEQPSLLWAGLAFAILQGFSPVWYFTGQERIPLIGAIAVGAKILGTLAIFALVRTPNDGWLVLASYAGASLLATGAGYVLMLRDVRPGRLSLDLIGRTLRLGASMFLARIGMMMHAAGNVFLLGLLVVPHQVAFFAASEKLCRPVAWLLQPVNTALLPRLSHLVGASPDQAQQLAALSLILQGVIGILLGLTIGLFAPWLVDLLFGAEYTAATPVLRVMAAIIPLMVLNGALVTQWMIPHALDRMLNAVILTSAGLNLVLALILASWFGALGMAWVTVIAESFILTGLIWSLHHRGLRPIAPEILRQSFVAVVADRSDPAADPRR
jgi:PST family polysaccharide transporter